MTRYVAIFILFMMSCRMTTAQEKRSLLDSLQYNVELQATLSGGEHTPLWLNANRYGLSSVRKNNGYLRGAIGRPLYRDSLRRWGVGYGLDVAVASRFTSKFIVQQAYVEGRWLKGVLTLGSKEYPMELKNKELSSGSQTLGVNARPIPQVRIALPDYWTVPYTKQWLAIKGHISYGMQTDDGWQKDFTRCENRYTEHTLYHSKAGYLRIGPKNITLEIGLEMAAQFGGTSNAVLVGHAPNEKASFKNDQNLKAFLNAFTSGGSEKSDGMYQNSSGNIFGSWVARLNLDFKDWYLGLYADHYFEDHSSMFLLDYDGYGSGEEWNQKIQSRYFLYDLKDIMLGAELHLKRVPWMDHVVIEYMNTKYQSGPVYHDHTVHNSTHISGRDNYYNHYLYTGNQHWGMVMGNPLYLSPVYNDDGWIRVENNRFKAWHLGVSGHPTSRLHYRVLATWQRGYGTYDVMYPDPRENVSLLAETAYRFSRGGWQLKAAVGLDSGKLLGDNYGFQLTVAKTGWIKGKK